MRDTHDADDDWWNAARVEVLKDPRVVLGASDAGAHTDMLVGADYPTRCLAELVREKGVFTLEELVHQFTDVPARLYGLAGRGRIEPGAWADLVVFDPETVGAGPLRSATDLPGGAARLLTEPDGVHHVLVAGEAIVTDGRPTAGATRSRPALRRRHRDRPRPRAGGRMTTRTYQVISADGHLEIPPDAWIRHVPEEYRDQAPRLVRLAGGRRGLDGRGQPDDPQRPEHLGRPSAEGARASPTGTTTARRSPAPATRAQRLREQDADGIDAEVLYPPVFISRFIENISDREAYLAMVRAYNTFLAEDYCSVAPDRLIGNAVIPTTGLDDAIAELRRVHAPRVPVDRAGAVPGGARHAVAPTTTAFWDAALELGMAITAHGGMGDRNNPLLVASAQGTLRPEDGDPLAHRPRSR